MHYTTIEQTIGNTPLVKLQRLNPNKSNTILLKLEGNNPAGSVKDRAALNMISQAERRGEISAGDTLIEATSGNTGIALAMVAAIKDCNSKLATLPAAAAFPLQSILWLMLIILLQS
jgi:cysteine synthase B